MSEPIRAAGGLVRRGNEVLLVHRPRYGDWTFPKGKARVGESDEDCARREVEEETGLRCALGRELASASYRALAGPKVVRYWEMTPLDGAFRPTPEVDEIRWLSVERAKSLLSYGHDAEVLESLPDPSLIVVRHASAGDPGDWEDVDALRPLDKKGRRQARELVARLVPYPIDRIVSSPHIRCVQTVEPLAEARELEIGISDDLADGAGVERFHRLLEDLRGTAALLCGHGGEIEALFGKTKKGATRVLDANLRSVELLPA